MGNEVIFKLLNKHKYKLSDSEYLILSYFDVNYEKAITQTIQEVAKNTHTSSSTIFRLCKKIGFSGFSEFKHAIKLKEQITYIEKQESSIAASIEKLIDNTSLISNISQDQLSNAINLVSKSKKIGIISSGYSSIIAKYMEFQFRQSGYDITTIENDSPGGSYSNFLQSLDLIIVISQSGNVKRYLPKVTIASLSGSSVLLITSQGVKKSVKGWNILEIPVNSVTDSKNFVSNGISIINILT